MTDLQRALEADLKIIETSWPDLLDLPRTPGGDRVDTSMASPTPVPVSVLSMRVEAMHTLGAITHRVWDDQHLTSYINLLNVPQMCGFLTIHAGWLATHGPTKETAEEVALIAGKVTELIGQTKARSFAAGMCPDCEGTLIAYMQVDGAPLPSDLRCNLNPDHVWTQQQWHFLGNRISGEAIRYEDAARRLAAVIGL
jgi:hypothetical protein